MSKKKPVVKWFAKDMGNYFYMERDDRGNDEQLSAHCVACAYAEVISKFGGDCDLRGLHRYGNCFQFLSVLVRQSRRDAKSRRKSPRPDGSKAPR